MLKHNHHKNSLIYIFISIIKYIMRIILYLKNSFNKKLKKDFFKKNLLTKVCVQNIYTIYAVRMLYKDTKQFFSVFFIHSHSLNLFCSYFFHFHIYIDDVSFSLLLLYDDVGY